MLFGAPSADNDQLLKDCKVASRIGRYVQPIVVGRWGVGKTATLISRAEKLEELISAQDIFYKRIWHVKEEDINTASLFSIVQKYSETNSEAFLISELQKVWKLEILRRVIFVLKFIQKSYEAEGKLEGEHWKTINSINGNKTFILEPIWKTIDIVMAFFHEKGTNVSSHSAFLNLLISDNTFLAVQKCISDLEINNYVIPVVGVEPIETPRSGMAGFGDIIVAALLNCFRTNFVENEIQRVKVFISIPWNRMNYERLNFPQHILPYVGEIKWNHDDLKEFINKRIEWEAKQRLEKIIFRSNQDGWGTYFCETITNNSCDAQFNQENSFEYMLRHTQWRARDVQTIARESVRKYCDSLELDIGEFFRKKHSVNAQTIKEAIAEHVLEQSRIRLEEARRKFQHTSLRVDELRGLKIPFTKESIINRLGLKQDYSAFRETFSILWESGVVGFAVEIKNIEQLNQFKQRYSEHCVRPIKFSDVIAVGFLFHYCCSKTPQNIEDSFGNTHNNYSLKLIIHPMFNEALELHISSKYPLGC